MSIANDQLAIDKYLCDKFDIQLDNQQLDIIVSFVDKKNVLITGGAGVGKSYVINAMRKIAPLFKKQIHITAMTGSAAVLIGGSTFHGISGFGTSNDYEGILANIGRFHKSNFWTETECIIIDEVSMMSKKFFELIDQVARHIREDNRPFGGIQMILVGDFAQLPPVKCKHYCFESLLFNVAITNQYQLTHVYRQHDDLRFAECLNNIRMGVPTNDDIELIKSRETQSVGNESIKPTKLYSLNINVDKINRTEIRKLKNIKLYQAIYKIPNVSNAQYSYFKKKINSLNINDELQLAVGAQVMLRINLNIDAGLCNGSRGVVVDFKKYPIVQFLNGARILIKPHVWEYNENKITVTLKQLPLSLAYAISIHKSQGMTLDAVHCDLTGIFQCGQIYTALSRVRSLNNLCVTGFDLDKIKCNKKVLQFLKTMQ